MFFVFVVGGRCGGGGGKGKGKGNVPKTYPPTSWLGPGLQKEPNRPLPRVFARIVRNSSAHMFRSAFIEFRCARHHLDKQIKTIGKKTCENAENHAWGWTVNLLATLHWLLAWLPAWLPTLGLVPLANGLAPGLAHDFGAGSRLGSRLWGWLPTFRLAPGLPGCFLILWCCSSIFPRPRYYSKLFVDYFIFLGPHIGLGGKSESLVANHGSAHVFVQKFTYGAAHSKSSMFTCLQGMC